jgi:hypothetical protein
MFGSQLMKPSFDDKQAVGQGEILQLSDGFIWLFSDNVDCGLDLLVIRI